jgi:hypothetical protein
VASRFAEPDIGGMWRAMLRAAWPQAVQRSPSCLEVHAAQAYCPAPLTPPSANPGVSSFDVSLETQTVVVKGTAPYETVLEKIKKTGKEVKKGEVVA